uniref:Uncharacterized protein n=1 Tax=Romanomermis culicivorax TaxID=13658 RepID=A0A915K3C9_ROMCU
MLIINDSLVYKNNNKLTLALLCQSSPPGGDSRTTIRKKMAEVLLCETEDERRCNLKSCRFTANNFAESQLYLSYRVITAAYGTNLARQNLVPRLSDSLSLLMRRRLSKDLPFDALPLKIEQ